MLYRLSYTLLNFVCSLDAAGVQTSPSPFRVASQQILARLARIARLSAGKLRGETVVMPGICRILSMGRVPMGWEATRRLQIR